MGGYWKVQGGGGGGSQKIQVSKGQYEAKLQLPEGWVVQIKTPFMGGVCSGLQWQ